MMTEHSGIQISKSVFGGQRAASPSRERILTAGAEMLASQGLGEVNTNTIARAAGVGVGTFYAHFDDKFALHRELATHGLALLQDALSLASRETREQSIEQQVRASVAAFVNFAHAQPALYRVVFSADESLPRGGRPGVGFSARALENRLAELQRGGHLEASVDTRLAARIFNAGQSQIVLWWLEAPDPPAAAQLIETLVQLHPAVACRR